MATLGDLAKLVRSKNAGPFWLTIDIMFDDAEAYRRARDAEGGTSAEDKDARALAVLKYVASYLEQHPRTDRAQDEEMARTIQQELDEKKIATVGITLLKCNRPLLCGDFVAGSAVRRRGLDGISGHRS